MAGMNDNYIENKWLFGNNVHWKKTKIIQARSCNHSIWLNSTVINIYVIIIIETVDKDLTKNWEVTVLGRC